MLGGDECSGEKARVEYKLKEDERSFLKPDLWALKARACGSPEGACRQRDGKPRRSECRERIGVADHQRARVAAGVGGGSRSRVRLRAWGRVKKADHTDPVACSSSCSLSWAHRLCSARPLPGCPSSSSSIFPFDCCASGTRASFPFRHWALPHSDPVHMPFPLPLLLLLLPPLLSSGVTLKGPPRPCRSLYSPYQKACGSVLCCYKASH